MDTDFETTQSRYLEFLRNTPAYLRSSMAAGSPITQQTFRQLCDSAARIFLTAAGSSIPAALHGAYVLQQKGKAASFLPTGNVLGLQSLATSDVVILCSQGMNRADAALVVSAVRAKQAKLIVFTANRHTPLTDFAEVVIYFDPDSEKLFCRPSGVAANLAAMAIVLDSFMDPEALIDAWELGTQNPIPLDSQTRYVTLASDMMLPANWSVALALREGCGILAQNFDIETYGHGNYVGDLANQPYEYITLSADDSTESARSVRRILPFTQGTAIRNTLIKAPFTDAAQANLYVLGVIAQSVYEANEKHTYNMNKPLGKEENRYYHELESYDR